MKTESADFPKQSLLYPGSILASIAHAVACARMPEIAHEHSWDGQNYNVQDSQGSRGTVAFSGSRFVGAFFSEGSDRNPFRKQTLLTASALLAALPSDLGSLAYDEALQYLLQSYNDHDIPIITAAFWGDGIHPLVQAVEPWSVVVQHGAFLVARQLMSVEDAAVEWSADYGFSPEETELVGSLFLLRRTSSLPQVVMSESDASALRSIYASEDGESACTVSLSEIGIIADDQ